MKDTHLYRFARTYLPWFFRLLMPIRVQNAGYMPATGAVVLCCNHMSNTDPVRIAYSQRRQIFFMAKEELFKNGFVAWILRCLGAFPVHRGRGDMGAINLSRRHLKDGDVLGVFIEGTRSKDGNLLRPKPGAAMLAASCHAPILPCCITAKGGGPSRLFRRVVITYGRLIPPEALGIEKGTPSELRAASLFVMDRIRELRETGLKEFR